MTIPDAMVAAMRAYLSAETRADRDDSDRQVLTLLKTGQTEGLGELLLGAFTVAARRRFSPAWSPTQVVRFVADVRGSADELGAMLNPAVAENQIRIAMGEKTQPYPDMEARGGTQLILLGVLTSDYTTRDLDTLLTDARVLADEVIAAR